MRSRNMRLGNPCSDSLAGASSCPASRLVRCQRPMFGLRKNQSKRKIASSLSRISSLYVSSHRPVAVQATRTDKALRQRAVPRRRRGQTAHDWPLIMLLWSWSRTATRWRLSMRSFGTPGYVQTENLPRRKAPILTGGPPPRVSAQQSRTHQMMVIGPHDTLKFRD